MVTGPLDKQSLLWLHDALAYWSEECGYLFVDLPWMVPVEYTDATRPSELNDIMTPFGAFVASGEQSFLQLWDDGCLPAASGYVGWTPCLRDERNLDHWHQGGFLKAELFVPLECETVDASSAMEQMLVLQTAFFARLAKRVSCHHGELSRELVSPTQIDLLLNGIEVGSYGLRSFKGRLYLYGTALALPRFALALEHRG